MPLIPLPTPGLADGQVCLRPFSDMDAPGVAELLQDRDVSRWTATIPWPYSEADARAWIGTHATRRAAGEGLDLAVTEAADALGAVGVDVDWEARSGTVGYWIGRPFRCRGLATRAVVLLSAWAVEELGLEYLELFTMAGNVASERVAAKAGFVAAERIAGKDLGTKRADVTRWIRQPQDRPVPL